MAGVIHSCCDASLPCLSPATLDSTTVCTLLRHNSTTRAQTHILSFSHLFRFPTTLYQIGLLLPPILRHPPTHFGSGSLFQSDFVLLVFLLLEYIHLACRTCTRTPYVHSTYIVCTCIHSCVRVYQEDCATESGLKSRRGEQRTLHPT